MARKVLATVLLSAALLGVAHADSNYTLSLERTTTDPVTMSVVDVATKPGYLEGVGKDIALSLNRLELGPCAVRTMHIHRNVDEGYYVLDGPLSVGMALPDGTIVQDTLEDEQVFFVPRNYIHTLYNANCDKNVTFLSFLNANTGMTSNIAKGAYNMPAGPFKAYADQNKLKDLMAAVGTFAFDPECLARCKEDCSE